MSENRFSVLVEVLDKKIDKVWVVKFDSHSDDQEYWKMLSMEAVVRLNGESDYEVVKVTGEKFFIGGNIAPKDELIVVGKASGLDPEWASDN